MMRMAQLGAVAREIAPFSPDTGIPISAPTLGIPIVALQADIETWSAQRR
jgi:hypothetical protein